MGKKEISDRPPGPEVEAQRRKNLQQFQEDLTAHLKRQKQLMKKYKDGTITDEGEVELKRLMGPDFEQLVGRISFS